MLSSDSSCSLPASPSPSSLPEENDYGHVPVLRDEVLACLKPQPGKLYVDATLGAGGHAEALLCALQKACRLESSDTAPPDEPALTGGLIGVDQDPAALAIARERLAAFAGEIRFLTGNF